MEKPPETPKEKPKPPSSSSLPKLNTIGISSNLDALMSSIERKEEEKQRQLKPLTNDSLLEDWDEFRSKINSKSIQASLSNVKFEIKENHLYAYVPSNRTGEVLSDSRYFIGFSDRFKEKEILNSIVVDMEKFPDYNNASETTKPKNDAEKYQLMVNKNPNLEVLRTTLDLKFHT